MLRDTVIVFMDYCTIKSIGLSWVFGVGLV